MKYKLKENLFYDSASGYLADYPSIQSKECQKKIKLDNKRKEIFSILIEHRGETVNYTELIKRLKINLNINNPKQRVIDIVNNELSPMLDRKFVSKEIIENDRGVGYRVCFEYECDSEGNRLDLNSEGVKAANENNNKPTKDYWENIPTEIQYMCHIEYFNSGRGYCSRSVLQYLIDNMYEHEFYYSGVSPYDFIDWVDAAVEGCYFPLEFHEDDWKNNKDEMLIVLDRAETVLRKYTPEDYMTSGYRKKNEDERNFNPIEKKQKLDVYFSVLYMYSEEWGKLADRLEILLGDSKRNIKQMFSYSWEDVEKLVAEGDWDEEGYEEGYFYFPGNNKWEPINWLMYEWIPMGQAKQLYAQVYERYVLFLAEINNKCDSVAGRRIQIRAEKLLRRLCDDIVWEIEDEIDYYDEYDNENCKGLKELEADVEKYMQMSSRSEQRSGELESTPAPAQKKPSFGFVSDIPF